MNINISPAGIKCCIYAHTISKLERHLPADEIIHNQNNKGQAIRTTTTTRETGEGTKGVTATAFGQTRTESEKFCLVECRQCRHGDAEHIQQGQVRRPQDCRVLHTHSQGLQVR